MMRSLRRRRHGRRDRKEGERGAALLEFAIALPVFIALLLLIFDAGLGYSASRSSAATVRSAARVGALAGESRDADFRVLDALRAQYGTGESVSRIVIYRSSEDNVDGTPPDPCNADTNCKDYGGAVLASLTREAFAGEDKTVTRIIPVEEGGDGVETEETCSEDSPDKYWCPLHRSDDEDSFLGVYVESRAQAATGLATGSFKLGDRAVFAMYFPPEPVVGTVTPEPSPTP